MSFIEQESREIRKTILSFLKWILIAHLTGTAGGWWTPPSACA